MITQEAIYARARDMAARAKVQVVDMLPDAALALQAEQQQRERAAEAQRGREHPTPAFTWARYEELSPRAEAALLDNPLNPQRIAHAAAERARIEREAAPLRAQRDELNRRLAALDEEWRRWQ